VIAQLSCWLKSGLRQNFCSAKG